MSPGKPALLRPLQQHPPGRPLPPASPCLTLLTPWSLPCGLVHLLLLCVPSEGKGLVCLIHYCIPRAKNNAWHMGGALKKLLKNGENEALDMLAPASLRFPWAVLGASWNCAGVPRSPSSWQAMPLHRAAFEANLGRPSQQHALPRGERGQ